LTQVTLLNIGTLPPPKKGAGHSTAYFGPCIAAKRLYGSRCHLVRGRPRPRPHCVTCGPSSPRKKEHSIPQFSAHVCCGQTAGWIKMPLSMEVGLDPGHVVSDGDPPIPKGHSPPNFQPMSVVAKGLDGPRCHLVGL